MPLVLERNQVLDIYAEASERKWVLPTFNSENLTCSEAILAAVKEFGQSIGKIDLPIIIGITNKYWQRPQSVYYTHTRQWDIGLKLFLADIKVLTSSNSPFANIKVMTHLDHIQWDVDRELLEWDMRQFSSIMYDASTLPFEQNIRRTLSFVEEHNDIILIEGACDEISESSKSINTQLTKPDIAEKYYRETGVDIIVANLGTEHRSPTATLQYHGELARKITEHIGPRLCLHGTSSVPAQQITNLFDDGIRKVNVWTTLERDSSPTLFQEMLGNAAKIVGSERTNKLLSAELLGKKADCKNSPSVNYYTTTYRQEIIFRRMKEIVTGYLRTWYI
jgi:fructose/tagatose bisphosphate aldolase